MPGPLAKVDTVVEATAGLDVDRLLTMGPGASLELWVPDASALDEPIGMRLVRSYTRAFNRIVEDEEPRGDGRTVVFRLADDGFPEGQILSDLGQKGLHLRWVTLDGPFEFCKVNDVTRPADSEAQVYTIVAQTRTFKTTYFGR
jgi:hypothetical protein